MQILFGGFMKTKYSLPLLLSLAFSSTSVFGEDIQRELKEAQTVQNENPSFLHELFMPKHSFYTHFELFQRDLEYYIATVEKYLENHVPETEGTFSHELHEFFLEVRERAHEFYTALEAQNFTKESEDTHVFNHIDETYAPLFTMNIFAKGILLEALEHIEALKKAPEIQSEIRNFLHNLRLTSDLTQQTETFSSLQQKITSLPESIVVEGEPVHVLETSDYNNIPQEGIVLVDYYANWCAPCRNMLPKYIRVAEKMQDQAQFFKCEVDQTVLKGIGIKTIPCIVLYKDGNEVKRTGSMSEETLIDWITAELPASP